MHLTGYCALCPLPPAGDAGRYAAEPGERAVKIRSNSRREAPSVRSDLTSKSRETDAGRNLRRRLGLAVDLERPAGEVHDPVLRDPGACVEARLGLVVEPVRGVGDLDDERGAGGVGVGVGPGVTRDDPDVRFGLGVRV
jgi:hypothetical protein